MGAERREQTREGREGRSEGEKKREKHCVQ